MFCRAKVSGSNTYIQIVENHREGKKVRQRVIATLGRLDHLQESGALDRLLQSACRFSEQLMVLAAQPGDGDGEDGAEVRRIGPALAFEGLWRTSGCPGIVHALLAERRFRFDVERAIFASVLHRIMVSGSDRAARARGCAIRSSTGRRSWNSSICTGRWRGWESRCRRPISITPPMRPAA